MDRSFVDKLTDAVEKNDSLLCVGLDPDLDHLAAEHGHLLSVGERLTSFCRDIIEQTADLVCCYKPNIAFFEQAGAEGWVALQEVIAAVPDGIPVLLDAKRGDIGSTARAYARAAFEVLSADAITLSPYLGRDSVVPFLAYEGKAAFLLCHTSNPSGADVQGHGTPPLYQLVAQEGQMWGDAGQVGFVVGATQEAALRAVRRLAPDRWILAPGVGAQGGDLAAALVAGLDAAGGGLIVPVSRGVLSAQDPRAAAQELRIAINLHRRGGAAQSDLVVALFQAGCVRFGEFTLASGQSSPIYIDLRRVVSYPELFERVVGAYSEVVAGLAFDRLAAVPYAALPAAAALALQLKRSLVYPRKETKGHGTGQAIEGAFEPGQTAVVIEDVVTSGGSLLQAIASMEEAGLKVRDVVVLVDREQGGRERLAERGYHLHAVLTLAGILETLHGIGKIDRATWRRVQAYLKA